MVIVSLTDIHGDVSAIAEAADGLHEADVVLLTGDITNFGGWREASDVYNAIREHADTIFAVRGNCDGPEVEEFLDDCDINLHGKRREHAGFAFLGAGGALPCPGTTPNEFAEDEFKAILSRAADGIDHTLPSVLVVHQPPRDTLADRVRNNMHVGSHAIRAFIDAHQPHVCFTGHIHEARCIDTVGSTHLVNPGPMRHGGYAYAVVNDSGVELLEIRGVR